ncbi:unnamed protein product [Brassica oleracea]|uniref:(rape) hypothetical protein n=1 Tax=Brassica napus TaxID=3708 RepID=A0A816IL02_BRANA|nr:unnamed protein product [Brassica napus]
MALLTTGSCLRRTITLSKNPPLWTSAKSCLSSFSTPVLLGPYPLFSLQYFVQVSELYVHVAFNLFTVHYYELKRFWAVCISIYVWYLILFYLLFYSIPKRYETFWKELDYAKNLWKNRSDLKVEDAGIAALFGLECFAWYCAGEITGRGFTFTGYYP